MSKQRRIFLVIGLVLLIALFTTTVFASNSSKSSAVGERAVGYTATGTGSAAGCEINFTPALELTDGEYDPLDRATMYCAVVTVPNGFGSPVTTTLAINHTYVGDLSVRLYPPTSCAPNSTDFLTLMHRPAGDLEDPPEPDPTFEAFGDSSDLTAANPITFSDNGTISPELLGVGIEGEDIITPTGILIPDASRADPAGIFTTFGEISDANCDGGIYYICIGDSAFDDSGTLESLELGFAGPTQPTCMLTPTSVALTNSNIAGGEISANSTIIILLLSTLLSLTAIAAIRSRPE